MKREIIELYKDWALELADHLTDLSNEKLWTSTPLDKLRDLPASSGVYAAVKASGDVLYIGKSNDIARRCDIDRHHKLATTVANGATILKVSAVPKSVAWHVEQILIAKFLPKFNEKVGKWWLPNSQASLGRGSLLQFDSLKDLYRDRTRFEMLDSSMASLMQCKGWDVLPTQSHIIFKAPSKRDAYKFIRHYSDALSGYSCPAYVTFDEQTLIIANYLAYEAES